MARATQRPRRSASALALALLGVIAVAAASLGAAVILRGTTSPPSNWPVLVGAGDIATCGGQADEATADLLDGITGTVFTAGDNAYESGTPAEFERCYGPSWGRHKDRTLFPAAGNHEYLAGDATGFRRYFRGIGALPETTWYSGDVGSWHVVVLDSNCQLVGCDEGSPQMTFLEQDLEATTARCVLAIWHHARFSSGSEHGSSDEVDQLWRTLYAAGADVVVSAHDHSYERFAPQDPDANLDTERGMRQFVVGTGGAPLVEQGESQPNSEVDEDDTHGVLRLELRSGGYAWEFVPVAGDTFSDTGEATCH